MQTSRTSTPTDSQIGKHDLVGTIGSLHKVPGSGPVCSGPLHNREQVISWRTNAPRTGMRCLAAPCPVQLPEELARPQQTLRETGFLGAPCKGPTQPCVLKDGSWWQGVSSWGPPTPLVAPSAGLGTPDPFPWPLSCPGTSRAWLFLTRRLMMALGLWTLLFSA